MTEACPWCKEQFKNERALIAHVHQKHDIKKYREMGQPVKDIITARRKANEILAQKAEEAKVAQIAEKAHPEVQTSHENPEGDAPKEASRDRHKRKKREKEPKEEKPKEPAPPRDKFFADIHPAAAAMAPKIIGIVLGVILMVDALRNIITGNFLFVLDWYQATIVLPLIVGIFTYPGGPLEWFAVFGPVVMVLVMLVSALIFAAYMTLWRALFKTYFIERGQTLLKDGRVYWSSDNRWTRWWDRVYRSPERKGTTLWLKQSWWPPINPFNPGSNLTILHLSEEEEVEKDGLFTLVGQERRFRRFVGPDEMETTDTAQDDMEIPLEEMGSIFLARREDLIVDTQKFSHANPEVRLHQLREGTYLIQDDVIKVEDEMDGEREKK